jgi:signal transduction histidine kinase
LSFLQSVAGEAAIAIKNAQLLEIGQRQLKELQQLSQKLLLSREAEARRISQELHDVMGQSLTAISINLAEIKRELGQAMSTRDRQRLEESEMLTRQTLQEMRELSLDLRPSMLDELGLVPTLRWYVHRFGQRLGIPASLEVKGVNGRMAPEIETGLYRVVQEGLTNVARHAQANTVCVRVSDDGARLVLAIEDDGLGFDHTQSLGAGAGEHMGLIGMRERVALLGGTMQVDSTPGRGTVLLVCLPDPCTDHAGQRQMDRMTEPL